MQRPSPSSETTFVTDLQSQRCGFRRKPHAKSRSGCLRCKQRRVKCDERRPHCTSCEARGFPCVFPDPTFRNIKFHYANPTPTTSNPSSHTSNPRRCDTPPSSASSSSSPTAGTLSEVDSEIDDPQHRPHIQRTLQLSSLTLSDNDPSFTLSDVKLLHHYLTVTAPSFQIVHQVNQDIWIKHIPEIAFRTPHIMHALLTVAASHLRALDPHSKAHQTTELRYRHRALQSYRSSLRNATHDWEATAATGLLLHVHSWSFIESDDDSNDSTGGSGSGCIVDFGLDGIPCLTWRTRDMLHRDWERHADSPFAAIFGLSISELPPRDDPQRAVALLRAMFSDCSAWPLDEFEELRSCIAQLLAVVDAVHGGVLGSSEVLVKALAVPSMCSTTLVEMLRRDDYKAILVIGLYYSLLKTVLDAIPGCWWATRRTELLLEAVKAGVGADQLSRCSALIQQSP